MIQFEEVTSRPTFSKQLENKILFSNHSHDTSVSYQSTYTLKYVFEGYKFYSYGNHDIKVSKGEYVILNNGSQLSTKVLQGTKGLSLFFSPKLIEEIQQFYSDHDSPVEFLEILHGIPNNNVQTLLNDLYHLCSNRRSSSEQQRADLFMNISELVLAEQVSVDSKFSRLNIVKHDTKRELYKSVIEAKNYIRDNFRYPISLDTISRDIGLSKYYLHRLFREINGVTPLEYLIKFRLEIAKNKLQHSKDSILDIAISCGFDNNSYFSNTFKKYTGLSPSRFREIS